MLADNFCWFFKIYKHPLPKRLIHIISFSGRYYSKQNAPRIYHINPILFRGKIYLPGKKLLIRNN